MELYKVKLTLGDWSGDGHCHYNVYKYISNYPTNMIQQAYKESCKKTGLSFSDNADYTGLNLGYDSAGLIWTEYGEDCISKEACQILKEYGIDVEEYCDDLEIQCFSKEAAVKLIMDFIKE